MMTEPETIDVVVHSVRNAADTIRAFEFRALHGGELPPTSAGAHIAVNVPGVDWRSYSLVNGNDERDRYVIAVNRDPKSRGGSAFMCENLAEGDRLQIRPPANHFKLVEQAALSVLVAGGIGITPIYSMIQRLEARRKKWQLHFAARSRARAAFVTELKALEAAKPGRVFFHFDDEHGGAPLDLPTVLAGAPAYAQLYACGPEIMLDAFRSATNRWPDEQIHLEHFSGVAPALAGGFTVQLQRSGREFEIPPGLSIMQVLLANDVFVPRSCMEGVCGTCETRVLEGVPDHRDKILSDREKATNRTMLICCSGAKSDRLVLDL
ncbi:PDR/VanB family oxidoreductase [Rhizobium halophytocola]|uniref:Vanillate O-demethylase ferredoxin subunit n=1 Tax=Rhizobium halophytocola TaxID=735519 RepID=A0ABS4DU26_9HYPH|nr:PDR/VanB family oxidoreductase [Rhizobium halophytocola]MBP1849207.1 vanillate O-demethylase ferredoxin subunit [Rhizobium halophytocola]